LVRDLPLGEETTIERLTVNGFAQGGNGTCDYRFFGIVYFNAAGVVRDSRVTHVRDQPFDDCESGVAVENINEDGALREWSVTGSEVEDYQLAGVVASETGLDGTISDNTLTGRGPQEAQPQTGIAVSGGAEGTVSGNTVTANECGHPACGPDLVSDEKSGGVSLLGAGDGTEVIGNELHQNDVGVLDRGSGGARTVTGNDVTDNQRVAVYTDDETLSVTNNDLSDSGVGLAAVSRAGGSQPTVTAIGNTVTGGDTGIALLDDGTSPPGPNVSAHFNRIAGNPTAGLRNETSATVDGENNWWGCNLGPGNAGCDLITGSGAATVDANPWLVMRLVKGLKQNGKRTITANLRFNSDDVKFVPTDFPDGTVVAFTATRGTIPSTATTLDGKAVVIHRKPGSAHRATITATLDGQSVQIKAR
jgi:hypothetical protein